MPMDCESRQVRTVSSVDLEQAAWIAALASVPLAVASAVVAVFARRDARRSAGAAERSAQAAEDLTAIERRRRHEELAPRLSVVAFCRGHGSDRVRVTVRLDGPVGLDRLDQVVVRVCDDKDRNPVTAGGPTQEQIATTVWGPYRFVPGVDGADQLGRSVPGFPLARGESRSLEMEPTPQPSWVSAPEWWRHEYADQPIRLEITCIQEGELPWRSPVEVEQPQPRFAAEVQPQGRAVQVVARNVGTAPARTVCFRRPPTDSTVTIRGGEESVLDVGDSISALVLLVDQSTATWVELAWTDYLGAPRRQRVDLVGP
jgi:hypothetical protein